MENNAAAKAKKPLFLKSLSWSLPILFVSICVILTTVILAVVYIRFERRMIEEYTRISVGITNYMEQELDTSLTDEYIEKNYRLDEYRRITQRYKKLRQNYPDVCYIYIYKYTPDGWIVVMDIDMPEDDDEDYYVGCLYPITDSFDPYTEDLKRGKPIPALKGMTEDGYLLTYLKPVYDEAGVCQYYLGVDFSMDDLHKQDIEFVLKVLAAVAVVIICLLILYIYIIEKYITNPLNSISGSTAKFSYETEADRSRNIEIMEELNISTGNEIETLYRELISMMKDSLYYMTSLKKAESDIKGKNEQIGELSQSAYKDALTGVGNKAAYLKETNRLDAEIASDTAEFAIVMADANDLKKINDIYGHKAGDAYIKGCCHTICDIYKHSPVFRIGGDEFAVILKGEDYSNRYALLEQADAAFESSCNDTEREPWLMYSASLGMGEYASDDNMVELVFKRADNAMYKNKLKFKQQHGSYR
ncbi:MAG: GGDEF domain-containing protein [Firmicutes bacterium]|nr:GGDEF domain-containing protein [Bacillota bacterium]